MTSLDEVEPAFSPDGRLLSDNCLDAIEKAWGVILTKYQRQWVRFIVQLEAEAQEFRKARKAPDLAVKRRIRRRRHKDIAKCAEELSSLIAKETADGSLAGDTLQYKMGHYDLSIGAQGVLLIAKGARVVPSHIKVPAGRPSYAQWEGFILALAQTSIEAGCKPTTAWCEHRGSRLSAFWSGIEEINKELPVLVRVNVGGLAEHAHKHKWLAKQRPGRNP